MDGTIALIYIILVHNLKGRDHIGDLGIHGTIISKWILTFMTGF
jgi:hypothetical protein